MFSKELKEEIYTSKNIQDVPLVYQSAVIHTIENLIDTKSEDGCVCEYCTGHTCGRCKK